jgi:hypothetical protein
VVLMITEEDIMAGFNPSEEIRIRKRLHKKDSTFGRVLVYLKYFIIQPKKECVDTIDLRNSLDVTTQTLCPVLKELEDFGFIRLKAHGNFRDVYPDDIKKIEKFVQEAFARAIGRKHEMEEVVKRVAGKEKVKGAAEDGK